MKLLRYFLVPFLLAGLVFGDTYYQEKDASGTWVNTVKIPDGSALPVGGFIDAVSASFVRPANTTTYSTAGLLVANSTTAGSVVPLTFAAARVNDGGGWIDRVRFRTSSTTSGLSFRIHFYKAIPTVSNGDGGAWLSTESTYLGSVDVTTDRVFTDGAKGIGVANQGRGINFTAAGGTRNIYALVQTLGTWTTPPSAGTITITLEVFQY